ncbi:phosphate regulon sensor histidine kinase PhoR [Thermomonas haemolytica]|uniref:Phosphate regulon sensor protein PhoR n=1 Tax=Thermomonas haemolytica TaxID=141949 RepID=A0A4R3N5L2_9GAMM|nr:phosphate regulon sensor histidine kinase PhoR [Thermomonas haemolytica]TCT24335.1 two-component system phosphate regulon sensor histidine kinase PhoR [Thermomonas haemolytica]TNY28694.1 phosphate regulon sensor histidine kinase PhoR [Thermomonas haemolytica]
MPSIPRHAWFRTLSQLLLVLAAGLLAGLALGQPWPALAITALGVVGWHYWRLHRLLQRLAARQRLVPHGNGVWSGLDALLYRGQTEMRARKRRLLAMLRAYRAVAAALPDAVVLVERNSQRILWFNEAATPLLGLRYPRHHGAPLADALRPLPMAQWLAAGRNAEPMEDVASPADPGMRLSLRLLPYSDDLWLLLARDVSKLLRLEHMRRDFVANVSHELRTPLTVIHGYLEMLDADDHPEWAGLLDEMRRQSQRMARLVEDLLTLSRLEARDQLAEEHVAMAPLLATLRREAEALSGGRHRIRVEDEAQVDLRGASKELHSAFGNLVSNAVRYTPDGGEITVRFFRESDGSAVLAVRDTGYGIPAAHLPRLTERFYRVSTSRSRESGGTGLGLAIVKHVLGLHGAQLAIASDVGAGSIFSCRFGRDRILPRDPHLSSPPVP